MNLARFLVFFVVSITSKTILATECSPEDHAKLLAIGKLPGCDSIVQNMCTDTVCQKTVRSAIAAKSFPDCMLNGQSLVNASQTIAACNPSATTTCSYSQLKQIMSIYKAAANACHYLNTDACDSAPCTYSFKFDYCKSKACASFMQSALSKFPDCELEGGMNAPATATVVLVSCSTLYPNAPNVTAPSVSIPPVSSASEADEEHDEDSSASSSSPMETQTTAPVSEVSTTRSDAVHISMSASAIIALVLAIAATVM